MKNKKLTKEQQKIIKTGVKLLNSYNKKITNKNEKNNSIFTAHYNIITEKIVGANKNTIVYYHEEGHKQQHKLSFFKSYFLYKEQLFFIILIFLSLKCFNYALLIIFCILIIDLYMEIDAWIFAIKKYFKLKK